MFFSKRRIRLLEKEVEALIVELNKSHNENNEYRIRCQRLEDEVNELKDKLKTQTEDQFVITEITEE